MQTDELQSELTKILNNTFHFESFRPGQLEAITTLLTKGRLLCIQPTGHGKSLLYQLPAVLSDGITLVISPLLALMRDQLSQLKNRFGIPAASINTDQTDEENYAAKKAALSGKIKILFIAPEQLEHLGRLELLLELPIKLLVVDEAHCISTWGHDFRPSYRQIIQLAHALLAKNPELKLLGLTATANEKTEADIKQQLTVDDKKIFVQRESMNRPNIQLSVIHLSGTAEKLGMLSHLLTTLQGSGLIYCATRENTEVVAEYLSSQGVITTAYHAGIESWKKQSIQNDFIHDKYQVISATNALGMGIDKSNLRFIIHFDFPGSITAYYQEVGRAGRDGLPAMGILLYDAADSKVQKYFIDSAQPDPTDFHLLLNTLVSTKIPLNLTALKRLAGLHPTRLTVVLAELIDQGFIKKVSQNGSQIYQHTNKSGLPNLIRYKNQLLTRTTELKNIQRYAEQTKKCLMLMLRENLGDNIVSNCGKCNVCTSAYANKIDNNDLLITIRSWLERRTVPITLSKKIKSTNSGMAALDGKLRSPMFVQFMQERAHSADGMTESLLQLIKDCLKDLSQHYKFSCVVALPSRTWKARDSIVTSLAKILKTPVLLNSLHWKDLPAARQGELLNNDQRLHNVANRMIVSDTHNIPKGSILLIDDYTGSGATLNEAARALREHVAIDNQIIPFTIAAVKWRLGKTGMI